MLYNIIIKTLNVFNILIKIKYSNIQNADFKEFYNILEN
jgi:hypothetical protein